MISEFIEDDFSAVNSPSGSLVDVEAELDQSLEGMEVIPHADDLADLEQALDDVDEPVGHTTLLQLRRMEKMVLLSLSALWSLSRSFKL